MNPMPRSSAEGAPVCMITGPTSGLGRAIALELAQRGHRLVLVARNREKLDALADECERVGASATLRLVADVGLRADVRRAADAFLASGWPLHALVNNAGLINQRRRVTADGVEETLAVGYFGAFLLTMRLAERLADSAPSQVIFTTSGTYPIGKYEFDDLRLERSFGPISSYATSKLSLVALTRILAERLGPHGVRVNAYNPGMNYTGLAVANNRSALAKVGDFFWSRFADPVEDGIVVPIALLTDPAMARVNGEVFMSGSRSEMTASARDPYAGAALIELSEQTTGERLPARFRPATPRGVGTPLRIGVLGAARIAPFALFKHVGAVPGVRVTALAEEFQPLSKASAYARTHGIQTVYRSFQKLLDDPDVDAVYLALPISQHAEQALACIRAGKHLLCEKPLAANAEQATRVAAAHAGSGLVVAEAMHMLQHPLVDALRDLLASGEIGDLVRVDAGFSAYLPQKDFRFVYALGGGVTLDMGCYPIAFLRAVLGSEPEVVRASAELVAPQIDGTMEATLSFPNARDVRLFVGMRSLRRPLEVAMRFVGSKGRIDLLNFIKPEVYHHLVVRSPTGRRLVRVPGGSTYEAQLRAFVRAVEGGDAIRTTTIEAVKTLRVVDAIYTRAGLVPRGTPLEGLA